MVIRIDSYHSGSRTVDVTDGATLGSFLKVFGPSNLSTISAKVVRNCQILVAATPGDLLANHEQTLQDGDTVYIYPKKVEGAC